MKLIGVYGRGDYTIDKDQGPEERRRWSDWDGCQIIQPIESSAVIARTGSQKPILVVCLSALPYATDTVRTGLGCSGFVFCAKSHSAILHTSIPCISIIFLDCISVLQFPVMSVVLSLCRRHQSKPAIQLLHALPIALLLLSCSAAAAEVERQVLICGSGNAAHALASLIGSRPNYRCVVLTTKAERWEKVKLESSSV